MYVYIYFIFYFLCYFFFIFHTVSDLFDINLGYPLSNVLRVVIIKHVVRNLNIAGLILWFYFVTMYGFEMGGMVSG